MRLPAPRALVLGRLALGFVTEFPRIVLGPDVIFCVFCPQLAYSTAFPSSTAELRAQGRTDRECWRSAWSSRRGTRSAIVDLADGLPWPQAFVLRRGAGCRLAIGDLEGGVILRPCRACAAAGPTRRGMLR